MGSSGRDMAAKVERVYVHEGYVGALVVLGSTGHDFSCARMPSQKASISLTGVLIHAVFLDHASMH